MSDWAFDKTMAPEEAIAIVKKARNAKFFIFMVVSMPSSDGFHYPYHTSVSVTKPALLKVLGDMQRFHNGKKERGDNIPMVQVRKSRVSEYSKTSLIWIG